MMLTLSGGLAKNRLLVTMVIQVATVSYSARAQMLVGRWEAIMCFLDTLSDGPDAERLFEAGLTTLRVFSCLTTNP